MTQHSDIFFIESPDLENYSKTNKGNKALKGLGGQAILSYSGIFPQNFAKRGNNSLTSRF
jgi:hypothetical protein